MGVPGVPAPVAHTREKARDLAQSARVPGRGRALRLLGPGRRTCLRLSARPLRDGPAFRRPAARDRHRPADDVDRHVRHGRRRALRRGRHPEPPSAPVTVEVQGSPPAVRLLREALEEAYSVRQVGVDAGDQEVQLQLRVEGREGRG